uniref:Uncharacterized protein n=1 Tax=Acetithermum autotrophicum TaxID=1446466 RepID=H5SRD9_ACEAU|nr:hypothetical protein HGMM_OP2C204 [Candidatus Acetothermum autotrophicum]
MMSRREFLGSSLALTALALLEGCRHTVDIGSPVLSFHQGQASCGAGADDAQIQGGPGVIQFSGRMTMPDPCHQLDAMLETKNSELIVHITAIAPKPSEGFCIQCIGQATYDGEIVSVRPGQYTVKIRHGALEIKRASVTVL